MSFSFSDIDPIIKENYNRDVLVDLVTQRHPLLRVLNKDENWGGNPYTISVQYGNPQSVGSGRSNFSTIKSNIGKSRQVRFNLESSQHYGLISVDRESYIASADPAGALVDALDNELRSVMKEVGRDLARQAFGTSGNALGQRDSISSDTITLKSRREAQKFEVGMRIKAGPNADGSSLRTGVTSVTHVDYDNLQITVANAAALISFTDNDYIFREAGAGEGLEGLQAWLPSSAPSPGESFFGVDRSVSSRLYGQTYSATGVSIEQAFIDSIIRSEDEGGDPKVIVTNPDVVGFLQSSQQSNRRYPTSDAKMLELGFKGAEMVQGATILADRFCPAGEANVLDLDSWVLASRGDLVHFYDDDGSILSRNDDNDSTDARVMSYCQMGCDAPIHNVRITGLPTR